MSVDNVFTSPKIANAMVREFGKDVRSVKVNMKYQRVIGDFVRKIETAHKEAARSTQVFRVAR